MRNVLLVIIAALAIIILSGSLFTVHEVEQAVVTMFGKPIGGAVTDAGLHFKMPFLHKVIKFEKRIMEWDGDANEMPTKDNKFIYIDAFARWVISDPLKFYKSAKNEMIAQSRIDDIINGAIRDEITNRVMIEIIRSTNRAMTMHDVETQDETMTEQELEDQELSQRGGARLDIIGNVLNNVTQNLSDVDMGIEVIDIQVKRISYNPQVQEKLFNRMISEQNRIAEKYRAQGQGKKQEILGLQIQRKKEILSGAYLEAQTIRGNADAEAVRIYADTYKQAPDFYNFLKALETYEATLDTTTRVILSTDNKYLKYFMGK